MNTTKRFLFKFGDWAKYLAWKSKLKSLEADHRKALRHRDLELAFKIKMKIDALKHGR